jgi:hypothetical protein
LNQFAEAARITPITENEMEDLRTSPTTNFCKLSALEHRENNEKTVEAVEDYITFFDYHTYNIPQKCHFVKRFFYFFLYRNSMALKELRRRLAGRRHA